MLPWLVLWPAPLCFTTELLSAPDQETVQHLWGLWAAWTEGHPIVVPGEHLSFPTSFPFVLIDPGNLWLYGPVSAVLGPVAGYNAVLLGGLALMGAAGALLATATGGGPAERWLASVVAISLPALASNAAEGITESFGVGWVGVALAALLLHLQRGGWRYGALCALALGASVWTGPYNGVWAALCCAAVGLAHLPAWRRTLPVGALGALLASPVAHALMTARRDGLPGTPSRAEWEPPLVEPTAWRDAFKLGADAVDLFLPLYPGNIEQIGHTAYLGAVSLALAGWIAWREPRWRPWLLGALGFAVLSLGPWLFLAGRPLTLGEHSVLAPVGVLALAVPGVLRLTRWYRAAAVAGLLLTPVVARAPRKGWVALLVLLDTVVLSPALWPLETTPAMPSPVWAQLERDGAIAELPPSQWSHVPDGGIRDANLLEQVWHGRPNAATFFNLSGGAADSAEVNGLMDAAFGKRVAADLGERLASYGYAYVVVDTSRFARDPLPGVSAVLGEPTVREGRLVVFALPEGVARVEPSFPEFRSPRPPPGPRKPADGPRQVGPGGHRQ